MHIILIDNILELMQEEGGEQTPPPVPVGGQGQVGGGAMVPSEITPTEEINPDLPPSES